VSRLILDTGAGPAWADLDLTPGSLLLVIGHGAGGGVDAPDLLAVTEACLDTGISVARITQPYRVAGRKAPPAAPALDRAWAAIITGLGSQRALRGRRFVYGGRSSGARVACRTAADPQLTPPAVAVLALAFPVHPPGKPEKSRLAELTAVPVPTLVVQGDRDPFGQPTAGPGRTVLSVAGDHSLRRSAAEVGSVVADWLLSLG
jgi:uncharacterized protein